MTNTTLEPKDLPCLFESLVERDQNTHLAQCEIKEKQKWRFASTEKNKTFWLSIFLNYFCIIRKFKFIMQGSADIRLS
jgi:hypothetical protein